MLIERELAPTWRQIRSWFRSSRDELVDALRRISIDRQITHLLPSSEEEVLQFRHDRVRDAILAMTLARSMKNASLAEDLLSEPYYAELLGQALLAPGVEVVWVSRLRERNPFALFKAFQLFETPRGPLQETIAAELRVWLEEEVTTSRALDALRWEAARFLAETDSPLVLEFGHSFPGTGRDIREARFRNGDVAAAVEYCAGMELVVPYSGFVPLVEHVQARFGNSFTSGLAMMLDQSDLPEDPLRGALILAGHLAAQVLAPAVRSAWETSAEYRMSCFSEFLWAALRCLPESEKEASALLDPLCEAWGQLPDENSSTDITEPLQGALFRRGLGGHAVSALIRKAVGQLEWPITMLLNQVDAPEAVEFTVRQAAAIAGYWMEFYLRVGALGPPWTSLGGSLN